MASPSAQRLNSTALKKDFQLVTFKGLEKRPFPEYLLARGCDIFLFDTELETFHMFSIPAPWGLVPWMQARKHENVHGLVPHHNDSINYPRQGWPPAQTLCLKINI